MPRKTKMGFYPDWGRSGENVLFLNVVLKGGQREGRDRKEPESTGGTLIFSLKRKAGIC